MTDKPIVADFETALKLSIEKWEKIKIELSMTLAKWDQFCGFCHYASYLQDKAGPEAEHKCTYCDKRIRKVCAEVLEFKGKYMLTNRISKLLEVLGELKKELKTE